MCIKSGYYYLNDASTSNEDTLINSDPALPTPAVMHSLGSLNHSQLTGHHFKWPC
jgi:hypothetical protein